MSPMPAMVAEIRRECCERAGCGHHLNYADPCASCPSGHWGPYRRCPKDEPPLPSLARMAVNISAAVVRDTLAGRPRRSEAECQRIIETHCNPSPPCGHFRPSDRRCGLCGCPVADKIPKAMEHCPIGKW